MAVRKIPKKTVMVLEPRRQLLVYKDKYSQKRVAAYCRVSTDNAEQLTSYENQKKFYTEMIARNTEWSMAGIYADEGISGTQADKRPEFNRMIKDCLSGKIDYIITKSVSRFARNTVDCLDYVRMLKAQNIGIFFEEQNIDTLKSDSELYLIIYAGFAQSESESISKNITWSYRKNFQEGKYSFPYHRILGYRRGEDGEPEIIPEEAAVVERIFELFLAGQTFRQIGDIVRAEFDPKACRFELGKSEIGRILQNEKYCGDSILQKTVTIDCISKRGSADVSRRERSPRDHQPGNVQSGAGRDRAAESEKTPCAEKCDDADGKIYREVSAPRRASVCGMWFTLSQMYMDRI